VRRRDRDGTSVAFGQHLPEKPVFADLRHCAATPSSEQLTYRVPDYATLFDKTGLNKTVWRQGS
jgi:hypothetical protein